MNLMNRLLAAAFVTLLVTPGPALAGHLPPAVDDMIKAARNEVKTVDMDGFKKVIDNPQGELIVDVREESEYAAGHIPGAVLMPRGVIEFGIWSLIGASGNVDLNRPIYLQCVSGNRASLAAKSLKDLGFTNVTAVVMDLSEWQKAGYPFQK